MSNSEAAEPYTIIEPLGGPLAGDVSVPGDKSISHRAVLFAAMAEGTSHLSGVLDSEDVRASIRAVEALGAEVDLKAQPDGSLSGTVTGWGAEGPSQPAAPIDCGNSGTTARLLMGIVAPWDIEVTITGDESLQKRPMRRIVAPLAKMGVDFKPETPETLPITVCGNRALRAIDYASPMASAQLKTAVLLAGVFADGTTTVNEPAPSRNHTELMLPEFNVPTTAGTAAEVTINYVITDVEKKRKFVCVDTNDIPEIAVVDPDMMSSMPKGLTAATGMDALTHAIEGYITKGHCTISDMFHLEAIKLISENLRGAVQNTPEGREGMALGQYIAGMGFSNVGLGIVHSMAHGLSALYDTPHGVACAIILPTGLEYNKSVAGERYRAVGKAMGVTGIDEMNDAEAADATIAAVKQLSADVGIPANLHGILKEEDIQFLAESAFADACCPGNPRDTSVEEIKELYKGLL